jgi:hypothetical protein
MINFSLVDVKNITSEVPRSNFSEADLDSLANIILESGGIIRPLVVKATGAETYIVVDGQFEYYAAVRAREINPRKGEMVNAFVISPKVEDIVVKQAEILEARESSNQPIKPPVVATNLETRLANLELRFEKQINELKSGFAQERQKVDNKFNEISSQIPQQIEPLNLLNAGDQDDLSARLQRSRVPGAEKIAKAIVDARNKKTQQKFEDYRDVVKSVKGLGEKTILTIIDTWSRS